MPVTSTYQKCFKLRAIQNCEFMKQINKNPNLDTTASLHTRNHKFSSLVKSYLVKLETSPIQLQRVFSGLGIILSSTVLNFFHTYLCKTRMF